MLERLHEAGSALVTALVGAVVAAGVWLVRRVLTNAQQIALLEADLKRRDEQRKEDRQDVKDVKADIREIKTILASRRD